jgi:hypothetical protein
VVGAAVFGRCGLGTANKIELTSQDVIAVQRAGGIVCFASVRDRFGDYGRVALATLRPPPPLAQSCLLLSHTIWDFLGKRQRQEEAAHSTLGTDGSETDACLCSALLHHPVLTLEVSVASASLLFALSSFLFPLSLVLTMVGAGLEQEQT